MKNKTYPGWSLPCYFCILRETSLELGLKMKENSYFRHIYQQERKDS